MNAKRLTQASNWCAAWTRPGAGRWPGRYARRRSCCRRGWKSPASTTRRELYDIMIEQAVSYGIAFASEQEIDEINILQATFLAMERAMQKLSPQPELALIDGNRDHGASAKITTPHETIVGGDGASLSIAAASVLAKVSRDHYVVEVLDPMYPEYQFARHKGYGTKLHYQMLDQYGPSPVHRMTFLKKWEARR